jgi:precorrin-2 dehydrogenase / sirohydrochlorin ferrochelatase
MKTYPVCLVNLEDQHMVLIGGGKVAARKAMALLEAGAQLTAISPDFVEEFSLLAEKYTALCLVKRPYQDGDLDGAFLAIAATDAPEINRAVWDEARRRGCLVNVVDDPQHCNFIVPAVLQRGEIKIAISTGGASPALARRLKERLDQVVVPEYAGLADLLAELRPELIARYPAGEARLDAALRLVDADLLDVLRQQGRSAAQARAQQMLESQKP